MEARGHTLEDGQRGEVFTGDHLQSSNLAVLLLLDDAVNLEEIRDHVLQFLVVVANLYIWDQDYSDHVLPRGPRPQEDRSNSKIRR